jgi:hypothetical protein
MIGIPLTVALILIFAAPQLSIPQQSDPALQQERLEEARQTYESGRVAAIHVNDLAGNIHSDADARAFVDAVAQRLVGQEHLSWTTRSIRHRIAHAEYVAVSGSSGLIPEQRIVDIWNEYVRELDAPEETVVTAAELHNLRDAMYFSNQSMWKKEGFPQSLWTVPNVYAVDADGKVANGCRALEALKLFHDMFYFFQNVESARERVRKGVVVSDRAKQRQQDAPREPQVVKFHLAASTRPNPVMPAEYRYVQAHGERDYQRLLERLFAELFPAE